MSHRVINKRVSGYVLVEVLLAFCLALIIIVGMVSLGIATVKAATSTSALAEGGKLTQREIDRLRLLRDRSANWPGFVTFVRNCIDTEANLFDGCYLEQNLLGGNPYTVVSGPGLGNFGTRYSFGVTDAAGNSLDATDRYAKVVVRVWWRIGDKDKSYLNETILSDWRFI